MHWTVKPDKPSEIDFDYIQRLTPDERCRVGLWLVAMTRIGGCNKYLLQQLTTIVLDLNSKTSAATIDAFKKASDLKLQNLCGLILSGHQWIKFYDPGAVHMVRALVKEKPTK